MMLILLTLLVLSKPNPTLTPGVVRPLTTAQVCAVSWGKDRRHVSLAMKQDVFRRYGIPWSEHAKFEVDHNIPRSSGGADHILNLWAQPLAEAHLKDRLEVKVFKMVCAGALTLVEAQELFRGDWTVAYEKYIGPLGR